MAGMHNPAHPGEIIREAIDAESWTISEATTRHGATRNSLSAVVCGTAGISPRLASALERLGWSNAGHWMQMQGAYDLARAQAPVRTVREFPVAVVETGEASSAVSNTRYGRA